MKNIFGSDAVKLAGLQIDLLKKVQTGQITLDQWYRLNILSQKGREAHQLVEIVSPEDIDWDVKKGDIDPDKSGEYTMNPDTAGIDWENIPSEKIKTFDFREFIGKPRAELAKHLVEDYADKYYIPGIEYWKYLIENQDKVPQELKDGNYYYSFGSILRDEDGRWRVPCSGWGVGYWGCDAGCLCNNWGPRCRIFLLKK